MEGRETAIGLPPDLEAPSLRSGSLRSPSLRCGSSNSAVFNSIRLPLVVLMKVGIFLRPYSNCRWRRCLTDIGTEGLAHAVNAFGQGRQSCPPGQHSAGAGAEGVDGRLPICAI